MTTRCCWFQCVTDIPRYRNKVNWRCNSESHHHVVYPGSWFEYIFEHWLWRVALGDILQVRLRNYSFESCSIHWAKYLKQAVCWMPMQTFLLLDKCTEKALGAPKRESFAICSIQQQPWLNLNKRAWCLCNLTCNKAVVPTISIGLISDHI